MVGIRRLTRMVTVRAAGLPSVMDSGPGSSVPAFSRGTRTSTRWGVAVVFVLMLVNAPDVWKGTSDIQPFHPFATNARGELAFDERLLREYPETMNYSPTSIAWYIAGTEHDPHRHGEKTFAGGFTDLSSHFRKAMTERARKDSQTLTGR